MTENGVSHPDSHGNWLGRLGSRRSRRDLAAYQRLALQLHHDLDADGRRVVLVVSPTDRPVAARSAAMLAASAAEQLGEPVLLVDACPENPELSDMLGAKNSRGFGDLVAGEDSAGPEYASLLSPTTAANVMFLAAGISGHTPRLADARAFLRDADKRFAMVIVSGGAALHDPGALALAPDVGCALIAVVEHRTKTADLNEAQQAISLARAPRIGLMLVERTRRALIPTPIGNGRALKTVASDVGS